jgi:beta-mannosidase
MEQDYIIPGDFERFLYTGQILQAEAIKTAIESHRSDMPYCMGSLYWQINDCWPVASWSGIDYYKRWKALHYFVREAYKPVIVLVNEDDGRLEGRIISDRSESLSGELRIRTIGFDGKEIGNETIPVEIAPNTSFSVWQKSLADVLKNADPGRTVLVADLYTAGSFTDRCLLYFVKPKAMKLDNPGLEIDISESPDTYGVSLTAKFLAKNIFLSVEGFEGQFSDNYFDLLPGEKVTVTIPKGLTLREFKKKLKVLHL